MTDVRMLCPFDRGGSTGREPRLQLLPEGLSGLLFSSLFWTGVPVFSKREREPSSAARFHEGNRP